MKLAQNEVFFDGNIGESENFTIEASPKAFRILSSGLYSNSKRAIIRELSCNAYDSHKLAGHPEKPFDVTLPNTLTPYFEIRDYGVGLSNKDIMKLYITYFASTKVDSNDFIGALGLGSKSPFSYSDSFTVISYFDGMANSYLVFLDENKMPKVNRVSSVKTDEPSGMKIKIPVASEDYDKFAHEAKHVFKFFDTKPNFNGLSVDCSMEYELEKNGIGAIGLGYGHNIYAIQGNVCYRVEEQVIEKDVNKKLRGDIYLFFDIGDIHPTPSREEIDYDEGDTRENIINKMKQLNNSFQDVIDERLSSCDSIYSAVRKSRDLLDLVRESDRSAVKSFNFSFNGIKLDKFIINGLDLRLKSNQFYSAIDAYEVMSLKLKRKSNYVTFYESAFFLVDDKKNFRRRIREYCHENNISISGIVIIQNQSSTDKAFSRLLKGAKVIRVSDLPETKIDYVVARSKKRKTSDAKVYDLNFNETELDFNDVEYFAEINRWEPCGHYSANQIISFAEEKGIDVYFVKRKNIRKVSSHATDVNSLISSEKMTQDEVESYSRYLDYRNTTPFGDFELFSEFKKSNEYYNSLSSSSLSYHRTRYINTDKEGMNISPFKNIISEYKILEMFDLLVYSWEKDKFIDYVKEVINKEMKDEK